jgi:chorismate mutase/prephenate dehydrogenase
MSLIKERIELAKKVGKLKFDQNIPIRNFQVEKQVIERITNYAQEFDFDEDTANRIYHEIINASVNVQLVNHVVRKLPEGKRILVYGGAGKMGSWMVKFFRTSGHLVDIVDPDPGKDHPRNLKPELDNYDFIVLATPLDSTSEILEHLIARNPKGIIFDIASLKSNLIDLIDNAQKSGLKISTIHPMFGPDIISLENRNLVICETPLSTEINEAIIDLFKIVL